MHRIGEKSLAEWLTIFEGATFPYGPVNNMKEVFSDPQVGSLMSVCAYVAMMLCTSLSCC